VELTRTPRLLLRHWEEADLPAFFDLYSRDDVMRWLGTHPRRALATTDEARERLDRWIAGGRRLDPPLGMWAMVPLSPAEQSPVGTLLLMPLTDSGGPTGLVEIGWHLHPRGQGQGFATEAAEAVLAAAAAAGIGQVLALTDLDNVRSQAVAKRLDMLDEGITDRWYGLTTRQFRKSLPVRDE
jgi:RimJ/RimL family protein N-acetyltransferase